MKLATAGAFLAFGLMTGGAAVAQQSTPTPTEASDEATEVPDRVAATTDEDEGFDDWGLAGLLGLLGLAGLRKGEPDVRTVERREERVAAPVVDSTRVTRTDDVDTTRVTRDDVNTRGTRTDNIDPR